ncbi:MAG TPA: hypothetical protein VHZ75_00030 [Solirubrobacteraceae bacterium]|nr:hypothetical protein [Solirubrobacteraceae bacterium]
MKEQATEASQRSEAADAHINSDRILGAAAGDRTDDLRRPMKLAVGGARAGTVPECLMQWQFSVWEVTVARSAHDDPAAAQRRPVEPNRGLELLDDEWAGTDVVAAPGVDLDVVGDIACGGPAQTEDLQPGCLHVGQHAVLQLVERAVCGREGGCIELRSVTFEQVLELDCEHGLLGQCPQRAHVLRGRRATRPVEVSPKAS